MNGRATVRLALVALVGLAAASCARDVQEPVADAASVAAATEPATAPVPAPVGTTLDTGDIGRESPKLPSRHETTLDGGTAERAAIDGSRDAPVRAAALDFDSLAKRLRKTKAIKLSAKLAFRSQSNELLDAFRAYHRRDGTATLAQLRQSYDRLFRELHVSLQERDPSLDRDVAASRAALWEMLADPAKFVASELMAGG